MSESLQQARLIISLDKPTPSLRVVLAHASQRPSQHSASADSTEADIEPEVPESYIRELRPSADDESQSTVEAELELLTHLGSEAELSLELSDLKEFSPPPPLAHPILNRETALEDPPILGPPQLSIWLWFWLAVTCSY